MWGNCLFFAIFEIYKNGGTLYIEKWGDGIIPHFSIERNNFVYDFSSTKHDGLPWPIYEFWFNGEPRKIDLNIYKKLSWKKRIKLLEIKK